MVKEIQHLNQEENFDFNENRSKIEEFFLNKYKRNNTASDK